MTHTQASDISAQPNRHVAIYVTDHCANCDLAESVGTYRKTAAQVLNDFKAAGMIDISRKRRAILDRAGLAAVEGE